MDNLTSFSQQSVKTVYWVTLFVAFFYLYDINITYSSNQYNIYLFPPLLFLALTPFLEKISKFKKISAWWSYLWCCLVILANLHVGGGFSSSGIIWISIFPLIGGLLFRQKGMVCGAVLTFLSYLFFLLTEPFLGIPKFEKMLQHYQDEKIVDISLFCLVIFYFTFHFFSTQTKSEKELEEQKNKFDVLLSMLLHDIAGPLSIIKLKSRFALEKPDKSLDSLSKIEKQSDHLIRLITEIRQMKSVADEKTMLKIEKVNLVDLLKETVLLNNEKAQSMQIQLVLEIPKTINELWVSIDPIIFQSSVVGNLLSNAIKFSDPGSKVMIQVYDGVSKVIVDVIDQGVGIPNDMLSHLFEFKSKTSRSGTLGEKGTGYGLSLVYHWIKLMKGDIFVSSVAKGASQAEAHGTTFRIELKKTNSF